MQPQEENTFTQVPWFATTQTGSIDLYASAVSRYSSNLNHSNSSHSQAKTSKRRSLKKGDKLQKQNSKDSVESETSNSRRRSNPVTGSSANLSAWSKEAEVGEDVKLKEINSSRTSLKARKDSLAASINDSRTSLKKLLSKKDTDQKTFIEPLDPIMSYSSQIEPSTNMVRSFTRSVS